MTAFRLVAAGACVLLLVAVLFSAASQPSPHSGTIVNGSLTQRCTDGGEVEYGRSGPIPTRNCYYPPDIP